MTVYQGTSFTPELTATGYALFRAGVRVSAGTCEDLAGSLRRRHERNGTRWRLLGPLVQAVLVIAFLRTSLTYAELAAGFGISEPACWRDVREGISGLADRARRISLRDEARALRGALRLSVRGFGEHLGVAPRTVSKWEHLGEATRPHPDTQAILDTVLDGAGTDVQLRFRLLLDGEPSPPSWAASAAPAWDYETWADDLDRAVVALPRQDFAACAWLTDRWLIRYPPGRLARIAGYLNSRCRK